MLLTVAFAFIIYIVSIITSAFFVPDTVARDKLSDYFITKSTLNKAVYFDIIHLVVCSCIQKTGYYLPSSPHWEVSSSFAFLCFSFKA